MTVDGPPPANPAAADDRAMRGTSRAGRPQRRVLLVDPAHQVPDYDRFLAAALRRQGWEVQLAVSPLLVPGGAGGDRGGGGERGATAGRPYGAPATRPPGEAFAFAPWLAGPGLLAQGFRRHPLLRRLARVLAYPRERRRLEGRWQAAGPGAVLHQQWSLAPLWDAPRLAAARRAGRPLVLTVHNVLPHERHALQPPVWRRLYRQAPALIVHGQASRHALEALLAEDAEAGRHALAPAPPIHVIPMPPDPPDPQLPLPTREAARAALGLAEDLPLALFLGHLRPYKGLDLALEAWPLLHRALPEARLWIRGAVGGGAAAERAWRARIDAAGGPPGIDFRPGYLPRPELLRCLAAADLVLLPYRHVDMSAVLSLALGHGRAVVATAVGGLPEALAAGGGLLVPGGDPASLAAAAAAVLGDEARRRGLEAEARLAAARWTWDDAAAATVAVYRGLPGTAAGGLPIR